MVTTAPVIETIRGLTAAGRHAEVVAQLSAFEHGEVEDSPELSLLYGSAQARLGHPTDGQPWVERALHEARKCGEREVEKRALNALGAIALMAGRIDEAADFFTQALVAASHEGDLAMIGRCSNNLGIISNLRGRHAEALGSYEMALAAFERAGLQAGVAQCCHNLGITYREQGELDRALEQARRAIHEAEGAGDRGLSGLARRGLAEIRVFRGELADARDDLAQALATQRTLGDPVEEAEALRIEALIQAAEARLDVAETTLRDVVARAETVGKPQLVAEANADLALVLRRAGRPAEAAAAARSAKAIFTRLGAEAELRKLASHEWEDDLAADLQRALKPLQEAQRLADRGRYVELLGYLGGRPGREVEQSPTLALLRGIAHARLGQVELGKQWAMVALSQARLQGDRPLEVRALNACGGMALYAGGIHEATHFFTRAQEQAMRDSDLATVGRCANNLGIIANMQGDYGRAVLAYTRAIAAYQQAHYDYGIAESHHNLGISYRELGDLSRALDAADTAIREADRLGDRDLKAQALAGRAEIRVARQEAELGRREAERALAMHREMKDAVLEAEDLRILAGALAMLGREADAEAMLRDVMLRAAEHGRPLLVAIAQRDLAHLLARLGRTGEARDLALTARTGLERLGAANEIKKLHALLATLDDPAG